MYFAGDKRFGVHLGVEQIQCNSIEYLCREIVCIFKSDILWKAALVPHVSEEKLPTPKGVGKADSQFCILMTPLIPLEACRR